MSLHFVKLPAMLFGVGRYTVRMELPQSGGLYGTGNVTYRGTEVGRVRIRAPDRHRGRSRAVAEIRRPHPVGSQSRGAQPIGDRRISTSSCCPATATAPPLKDGDVIPVADTSVPPDINSLLDRRQHRSAGNTARQPEDRHRRVVHRCRRARPRTVPPGQGFVQPGDRRAQESRPAGRPDRSIEAGARLADQHVRCDCRPGRRTWPP